MGSSGTGRPKLSFPGVPESNMAPLSGVQLGYGPDVPTGGGSDLFWWARPGALSAGLGLDMGTVGGASGSGESVTGSVDGAAPWVTGLKGLAGAVLQGMGAGSGDRGGAQVVPASYGSARGGFDVSTLFIVAAVGFGVYMIAGKGAK
jgi:hypothetical protein